MRVLLFGLLGLLLNGCSRRAQATPDASPDVAVAVAVDAAQASSAHVDAIDPPMSVKKSDGVSVTFVGANGANGVAATKKDPGASGGVGLVFRIDNEADEERRIVGEMDVQATTLGGLSGELAQDPKILKQCMGVVPPHGRFVCSLVYSFGPAGSESPSELRVRVAGAWFHVVVNIKDAGR